MTALENTVFTSRRSWASSTGISETGSRSGDRPMYDLINQYARTVVGTIPSAHVTEYEWLVQNPRKVTQPDYQNRYRRFWAMNAARLSPTFYAAYFGALNAATTSTTLNSLAQTLHAASTNSKGRQSLQFSFA